MISHALRVPLVLCAFAFAGTANAAIIDVTGATLKTAFAKAKDGDTLRVTGDVTGSVKLINRTFASTVTIDATNATFTDSFILQNLSNVTVVGGTFGSATGSTRLGKAIAVYDGSNINFINNTFVGNKLGTGLAFNATVGGSVTGAQFQELKLGILISSAQDVTVEDSRFTRMSGDGVNIANSHFVTARANQCTDAVVLEGYGFHMDCIQLWGFKDAPTQSDIFILDNYVSGPMQGFTSFNYNEGALRVTITGNIVSTSKPQGIACYNCVDSIIANNIVTTLPGSQYRTSINIVGGSNNIVENNSVGSLADARYIPPPLPRSDLAASFGTAAAVPEPNIWAQLLLGFGLVGGFMRRGKGRRSPLVQAVAA